LAIEGGATILDAYMLFHLKNKPEGLLTKFYNKFGFEEVERYPFDKSYLLSKKQFDDIVSYSKKWRWDESQGYPDLVIMKWKGNENERSGFTKSLLEGRNRFAEKGSSDIEQAGVRHSSVNGGSTGQPDNTGGSTVDAVRGAERGRGGANDVRSVYSEISRLSPVSVANNKNTEVICI
jgi:hypothetical protein